MDILFKNDHFVFSYRVGGILKHNGKILLQRPKNDDYAIIGGHVAAMETSMETLKREFEEEIHAKIEVDNLLAIGEIYFPWGKRPCHQICLYYNVHLVDDNIPLDGVFHGYDELNNERIDLDFCWVPLEDLKKDITVSTFRENDVKGIAPRNLYKKFGFEEDELIEEFGYPNQRFVLHANIGANNVPIVVVRESKEEDLTEILYLYLYLHEKSVPEESEQLRSTWENIMNDNNHHLIVCEVDGKIVASCVCVVIPNLTRNVRPYAFVENVVTHVDYRKKGYATDCLNYAKHIAKENNCYKMMLLTGSKEESTLNFYRNAGYNSTDKTAFIQWIDM